MCDEAPAERSEVLVSFGCDMIKRGGRGRGRGSGTDALLEFVRGLVLLSQLDGALVQLALGLPEEEPPVARLDIVLEGDEELEERHLQRTSSVIFILVGQEKENGREGREEKGRRTRLTSSSSLFLSLYFSTSLFIVSFLALASSNLFPSPSISSLIFFRSFPEEMSVSCHPSRFSFPAARSVSRRSS